VFVLNLVDSCIRSDMATDRAESIEEDCRLLYVAMTRARDDPHLVQPERFYVTGQGRSGDRYVRPRAADSCPTVCPACSTTRPARRPTAGSRPGQ
jgi:superfamily I DNA/RNA helicase